MSADGVLQTIWTFAVGRGTTTIAGPTSQETTSGHGTTSIHTY